jgi:hypothetical protein
MPLSQILEAINDSYKPTWDLTTIPDQPLYAETARRRALKRSYELKPSDSPEQAEKRRKKREQMRKYRKGNSK